MTAPAGFQPGNNVLLGITFKICSVLAFTSMSGLVKVAGKLPPGEIVFFRSFFALIPILIYLAWTGHLRTALITKSPMGHVRRAVAGVMAMGFYFYGINRIPLPEATALNYASPLFIVILSALILGEKIRIVRWTAVLAGLVGVIIVFWPRFTLLGSGATDLHSEATLGALAMLAGAFLAAFAMIFVRALVKTEAPQTVVLYFSIASTGVALLTLPFGWEWLNAEQITALIGVGILGGIGQIFLTEGYRNAEASMLAPFEYASLIVAVGIGYFFFAEIPTFHTIIGGLIVAAAGIFIIYRERQLGMKRAAARAATPPQG